MRYLVTPERNVNRGGVGGVCGLMNQSPPHNERRSRVNNDVRNADSESQPPGEDEQQSECMDSAMYPRGGMIQARLIDRHPLILQKPVGYQVPH